MAQTRAGLAINRRGFEQALTGIGFCIAAGGNVRAKPFAAWDSYARALDFPAMFTGIVEETGTVEQIKRGRNSIELAIQVSKCARGLKVGDSLAVNGCCLTVSKLISRGKSKLAHFDLLAETWNRTNLQFSSPGRR